MFVPEGPVELEGAHLSKYQPLWLLRLTLMLVILVILFLIGVATAAEKLFSIVDVILMQVLMLFSESMENHTSPSTTQKAAQFRAIVCDVTASDIETIHHLFIDHLVRRGLWVQTPLSARWVVSRDSDVR